jgi:hypothetical protein
MDHRQQRCQESIGRSVLEPQTTADEAGQGALPPARNAPDLSTACSLTSSKKSVGRVPGASDIKCGLPGHYDEIASM